MLNGGRGIPQSGRCIVALEATNDEMYTAQRSETNLASYTISPTWTVLCQNTNRLNQGIITYIS